MSRKREARIVYEDGHVDVWRTEDPWEFYQVASWLDTSPDGVLSFEFSPGDWPTQNSFDPHTLTESYSLGVQDASDRGWRFSWKELQGGEGRIPIWTYIVDASLDAVEGTQVLTGRSWTKNSTANHVLALIATYEADRDIATELGESGPPGPGVPA